MFVNLVDIQVCCGCLDKLLWVAGVWAYVILLNQSALVKDSSPPSLANKSNGVVIYFKTIRVNVSLSCYNKMEY